MFLGISRCIDKKQKSVLLGLRIDTSNVGGVTKGRFSDMGCRRERRSTVVHYSKIGYTTLTNTHWTSFRKIFPTWRREKEKWGRVTSLTSVLTPSNLNSRDLYFTTCFIFLGPQDCDVRDVDSTEKKKFTLFLCEQILWWLRDTECRFKLGLTVTLVRPK